MSNLAEKLMDADVIVIGESLAYNVLTHDGQQMKEGSKEPCIQTEEDQYKEETAFTFDQLLEHDKHNNLEVYTLQHWDNILPRVEDLERVCEENFPGSEIITFMEAVERWSELRKEQAEAMEACLKLRCLGHAEDAKLAIRRATEAEYKYNKRAEAAVQIMHAMQGGRNVVFYEWTDGRGDLCKGGRYGTASNEYVSFYL